MESIYDKDLMVEVPVGVVTISDELDPEQYPEQYTKETHPHLAGEFEEVQLYSNEVECQYELTTEYNLKEIVSKVRKTVGYFRNSPVRTDDILHEVTNKLYGKKSQLILDSATRWDSTMAMITRFVELKGAVDYALNLVDMGIQFSTEEWSLLATVQKSLELVTATNKHLCRRSETLLSADLAFDFLLQNLPVDHEFGAKLYKSLVKRINERRTVQSEVLYFLHYANQKKPHFELKTASKSTILKFLNKLWTRGHPADEVTLEDSDEEVEMLPEKDSSERNLDFATRMSNAVEKALVVETPPPKADDNLKTALEKEYNEFCTRQIRGPKLEWCYKSLLTITPTSVEAERNFSASGRFCNKIRSRIGDDSLKALSMLKTRFK